MTPNDGFIPVGAPSRESLTTVYRRVVNSGAYHRVGLCAGDAWVLAVINDDDTTPPTDDSEAILLEGRDDFVGFHVDGRGLWLRSDRANSVTVIGYRPVLA